MKIILICLTIKIIDSNPRKIMGFDNDLFLKGKDAELVILDPKERWKFSEKISILNQKNFSFYWRGFGWKS